MKEGRISSTRLLFRHILYNLRGGFLLRPLAIALVLGAVGGALSWLEVLYPSFDERLAGHLFPSGHDYQVAQVVFAAIAGSVMTVVSIVFAILLMSLTLASMQFSPRIIVSFAKDRVTQWTLGLFLGTFLYCVGALPAAHAAPVNAEPRLALAGALVLAVLCVGCLLLFIHHISEAISVNHMVDRIAQETEAVIDDAMPNRRKGAYRASSSTIERPQPDETILYSTVSGYIRFIDIPRLLECANTYHFVIRLLRRVGHYVPAGAPLLALSKDGMSEPVKTEILLSLDIGPSRTLQQDVEFGILQLVDIALRAISPAVNDPSTGISCVDQLSRLVIRFINRELPDSDILDPSGELRVRIPWIGIERMLDAAFEQIRMYSQTDRAVSLRLLRAYVDIADSTPDEGIREVLYARGQLLVQGCRAHMAEEHLSELEDRLQLLGTGGFRK